VSTATRHRGGAVNIPRLRYEMGRRGWTTVDLAEHSGATRWSISRALNGHAIDHAILQKIAEALAAAPVVDGGLLLAPTQLEDA
jgi:transcriptional regulator with XRE-family HTH domain